MNAIVLLSKKTLQNAHLPNSNFLCVKIKMDNVKQESALQYIGLIQHLLFAHGDIELCVYAPIT
jgi:hypothetical protein